MKNIRRIWPQSKGRAAMMSRVRPRLRLLVAVLSLCVAVPALACGAPQENARTLVGSVTINGVVEVNGAPVTAQSMVFVGDSVATHENGNAILTISGKGELDIASFTQVVFSNNPRYLALVNYGAVTFNTHGEGSNFALRTGDYIVTVAPGAPQTAATVRHGSDGSGLVSCATGNVQVLAIEGDTSLALQLQGGQSTSLASRGETLAAVVPSDPILERPVKMVQRHWLRTALILAAGAAVAGAIVATHHGGGRGTASAPSPASPSPTTRPSPSPSPTPSPAPSPAPSPSPSPTPSPAPSPAPSPSPSPTPSPAPPPAPSPSPSPTPSPTPSPAPSPSPSPTPSPAPLPIPIPIPLVR